MSKSRPADTSTAFYDANSSDFAERTLGLDLADLYQPFLARLEPGARILDAGCGPGRDLRAFGERGYDAMGMDASAEMVRLAREHSGRRVVRLRFQDIDWSEEFDGIWANASLLHVPKSEMAQVLGLLAGALKPGGVLWMSFKYGRGERRVGERLFSDYDEEQLSELIADVPRVRLMDLSVSEDGRPTHRGEKWLNCLLERSG